MAGEVSMVGVLAASGPQEVKGQSAGLPDHSGQGSALPWASGSVATGGAGHVSVPASNDISFSVDQASGQIIFQVRDSSTGEMIRQVPSEEQVALEARMRQLLGTLLDQAV